MSIKITIDNNFFDRYELCVDTKAKEKMLLAFKRKRFSFYPTTELLTELFGLYNTKRKALLSKYASLCLDIMDYRILNGWNAIILSELGIDKENKVFLDTSAANNLKTILSNLSVSGEYKDIEEMLLEVEKEKEKNHQGYKENQDYHFRLLKESGVEVPKITFDEFYNMDFAKKIRHDTIRMIFERGKHPISENKIIEIVDNSTSYPYYYASSRIFMALFYRHIVMKRSVGVGDHYDQRYLIYLTKLDYLVSDDVGMKELAKDVFGGTKKVINFTELIELL